MLELKKINFKYLVVSAIVFMQLSCSTIRRIEKSVIENSYSALGLQHERKDNEALYNEAASWLHVPHRNAGLSKRGIDCSGLVYLIYKNVYRITLERNSAMIFKENCRRKSKNFLREGDLVFFNTGRGRTTRKNINHVGIYLKEDKFVHASTSRGVIVSDLDEEYYRKTWVCGGRVK
jgi:cell wall-associated NlpC family hydrolase